MRCPFCSHGETQVVETRESDEGDVIRRRRRCLECDKRFTTYERPEIALPSVVKKDGSRVDFDRAKLRAWCRSCAACSATPCTRWRSSIRAMEGTTTPNRMATIATVTMVSISVTPDTRLCM